MSSLGKEEKVYEAESEKVPENNKMTIKDIVASIRRTKSKTKSERKVRVDIDPLRRMTRDNLLKYAETGNCEHLKRYMVCQIEDLNIALCRASIHGHLDAIKLLMNKADPKYKKSLPLTLASESGHAHCVEYLLPYSDLEDNNGEALHRAINYGTAECVALLQSRGPMRTEYSDKLLLVR